MKRLVAAGMIAGMALLSASIPAQAQSSGRRIVYCQPKPFCSGGQISVCQLFGDADDACSCKRWSRCFGKPRTPPQVRALPRARTAPPVRAAPQRRATPGLSPAIRRPRVTPAPRKIEPIPRNLDRQR